MVKGTTRRVVVIKSPEPKVFDEAIFIVREDAVSRGVTGEEILREAQSAAERYIRSQRVGRKLFSHVPPWAFAAAGAGVTAVLWAVSAILF